MSDAASAGLGVGMGMAEGRGCTCFKVRRLARTLSRLYDQHLARVGLRTTQYSLLCALRAKGAPLAAIAAELGLERTTLTRNLKPLLEAELVTITRGPDARQRVVALTDRGRATVVAGRSCWRDAQDEANAALGRAGVGELHRMVDEANERLLANLTGEQDD